MGKKEDSIPYPPPPPYSGKDDRSSWTHAEMNYYPPIGMGVSTNHMPSGPGPAKEGFNVWYIQGATGFVGMPQNSDVVETLGRLETMKMALTHRHNYDISKIPRPPTPSDEDKAKAKQAKELKKDGSDTDSDDAPSTPQKPKALVCEVCEGKKSKETRKIKGEGTICWPCLWHRYTDRAEEKWLEGEAE